MTLQQVAQTTFTDGLIRDTSTTREYLGKYKQQMTLYAKKGGYVIEWIVFDADGYDIMAVDIGIWCRHLTVVEYDGVFDLPQQAVELLEGAGFNIELE